MRNPTDLGNFRGVNNIIARDINWLARDGVVFLGIAFALGCGIAKVLAGMAPVTV